MKKLLLGFSLVLTLFSITNAQTWVWGEQGKLSTLAPRNTGVVATDEKGNVYMAGDCMDTIAFNKDTLINNGYNAFLVKYNSDGTVKWVKGAKGSAISWSNSIATYKGAVVVAGGFMDTVSFGAYTLYGTKLVPNLLLVKYDSNGNVLWAKQSYCTPHGGILQVGLTTIDNAGNIYVTGNYTDTISFGKDTLRTTGSNIFLIKYDANGSELWVKESEGGTVNSITQNKDKVWLTGVFRDSCSFGTFKLTAPFPYGSAFIAEYDTSGNTLWVRQSTSTAASSYVEGDAITSDAAGNTYITGILADTINFGAFMLSTPNNVQAAVFLAKYDVNGNVLWAEETSSLNYIGADVLSNVCHDTNGYVYMLFRADTSSVKFGGYTFSGSYSRSYYNGLLCIAKINSSGLVQCGSAEESYFIPRTINGITADHSGDYVYTSGDLQNITMHFGPDVLTGANIQLPYVARWQPCVVVSGIDEAEPQTQTTLLYPNPSNGVFTIEAKNEKLKAKSVVEIYDMLGKEIYSNTLSIQNLSAGQAGSKFNIDIGSQSPGVYLYRVVSESGQMLGSGKFVIE
jgi:hypothetical protein